ncbi:MAG: hypothetical protein OXP66_16080, partial [Candidatus Tectomicrobia bacterium]|nr:hypothetical protein [Candidatus Tectomicrobia bacterium]
FFGSCAIRADLTCMDLGLDDFGVTELTSGRVAVTVSSQLILRGVAASQTDAVVVAGHLFSERPPDGDGTDECGAREGAVHRAAEGAGRGGGPAAGPGRVFP